MLALARDLATGGPLADIVQRVTVVIIPRSNPDGAEAFTRDAANKMDLNRDHLLLTGAVDKPRSRWRDLACADSLPQ